MAMSRILAVFLVATACQAGHADGSFAVPESAAGLLEKHCVQCHGSETSEAEVRLDALAKLNQEARLELLNKVQEQLFFHKMPPEDESQPAAEEQALLGEWVATELNKYNASLLAEKLSRPEYGNYIDHDQLFSGEFAHLNFWFFCGGN